MLEQAKNGTATLDRLRMTIVMSQGQSRNPEKRALEEGIVDYVQRRMDMQAVVIPHLYDLLPDGESYQVLRNIDGPIVLFSWIYGRAAHWVLDRHGVRGQVGEVALQDLDDDDSDEDEEEDSEAESDDQEQRMADLHPRPDRSIYCIDLRVAADLASFTAEIDRIAKELATRGVSSEAMARFLQPSNDTALALDELGRLVLQDSLVNATPESLPAHDNVVSNVVAVGEPAGRRWYPVIDFSRCTNCMECIDFCLFGVYGVDKAETILVEQPDNCRKGCPACSRVCPANAIIFPQHKTPAIAGANVDAGGMKIDLSKLFGAPERDEDPVAAAARERDEQLLLAGRQAVGMPPSTKKATGSAGADALDQLLDQLDASDV